jgi:hypothetical protein
MEDGARHRGLVAVLVAVVAAALVVGQSSDPFRP